MYTHCRKTSTLLKKGRKYTYMDLREMCGLHWGMENSKIRKQTIDEKNKRNKTIERESVRA